ncbi:TIGR04283 family arsenosugar biosynthesis glycosyltransferase [uncultured Gimesia sp.]|uniref:TIGR04283 family arsenosugar biosynthesis glycosyltransferase n=1 Tax=uncultured Gimesia sp. TaxID=1678688 RepID=UPI0030D8601F
MDSEPQISVIIPVLDGETCWKGLIADLAGFPDTTEFLFISNGDQPSDFLELVQQYQLNSRSQWQQTLMGRALQMNDGAAQASRSHLLFLHADSRLTETGIQSLIQSLKSNPDALHYFDLKFEEQSFLLMQLNTWGVYFRSHVLGIPFGDQGLSLSRALFHELGCFDETAPYGEDHLLVWKARRRGIRLQCTGADIKTSARKYQQQGWFKITVKHLWLTLRQAAPQFFLLLKERVVSWFQGKAPSSSS